MGLQNNAGDIVHAHLAGWVRQSIQSGRKGSSNSRGDPGDESVLHLSMREALQSFLWSRIHQTWRKLLRVCFAPFFVDIFDSVQLLDKPVAHWHICAADSWLQWFRTDNSPSLQGKNAITKDYKHYSKILLNIIYVHAFIAWLGCRIILFVSVCIVPAFWVCSTQSWIINDFEAEVLMFCYWFMVFMMASLEVLHIFWTYYIAESFVSVTAKKAVHTYDWFSFILNKFFW